MTITDILITAGLWILGVAIIAVAAVGWGGVGRNKE